MLTGPAHTTRTPTAGAAPFISTENMRAELGLYSDDSQDGRIARAVDAATAYVERALNRSLRQVDIVDWYPPGVTCLVLSERQAELPITVRVFSSSASSRELAAGEDYDLDAISISPPVLQLHEAPAGVLNFRNPVQVSYKSVLVDDARLAPVTRQAVQMLAQSYLENDDVSGWADLFPTVANMLGVPSTNVLA